VDDLNPRLFHLTAREITEIKAEFPHTDQLIDPRHPQVPSTQRKEGRGSMNRRHLVALAVSAIAAVSISSVAAAGALAPTPAPSKAATAALHAQDASPAPAALAHEALLTEHAHAAAVQAIEAAQAAQVAVLLGAQASVQTSMWSCIRDAESGDSYGITSGAYGILISTWNAYASIWSPYGSYAVPGNAPAAVQDLVALRLYQIGGGFGGWHDRCTGS
jgi:hypothetical protein